MAEQTVMEALNRLMQGRTAVVIAHHLSTIRHADKIFVIRDAEIAEAGSHDDLLAANGAYAELYKIQAESVDKWSDDTWKPSPLKEWEGVK